jgi:tetratricopeptide (TPR) repeat protein
MRYYTESAASINYLVERCYFDAEQGRLKLALDRLSGLDQQFPNDGRIVYAQGLLRRKNLGQGIQARALFERSYNLCLKAELADHTCWYAATNVTMLARDVEEFRRWADLTKSAPAPPNTKKPDYQEHFRNFETGAPYWLCIATYAEVEAKQSDFGAAAATLEVALETAAVGEKEAFLRRLRAQWIRELDKRHQQQRKAAREAFPDEERLALHEALNELDRAIASDPYDAELWNLKAAWMNLLERYSDALQAAKHAIENRDPYAKAHINAATALVGLGRQAEGLQQVEEALRQATTSGDDRDLDQAQTLGRAYTTPSTKPSLDQLLPILGEFLRSSDNSSKAEMERGHSPGFSLDKVTRRLIMHSRKIRGGFGIGYVPMIAELLSDFTPETVWTVMVNGKRTAPNLYGSWLAAVVYIVAKCDGVERRDAARLFVLLLLSSLDSRNIRGMHREYVLAPSEGSQGEFPLDPLIRTELARVHPQLPELIAEQEPIEPHERQRAVDDILSSLSGPIPGPNPNTEEVVAQRSKSGLFRRLVRSVLGS